MKILENKSLKDISSFKIGGPTLSLFEIENEEDIWKVHHLAKDEKKQLVIIGEGTNSIFTDQKNNLVVALMKKKEIRKIQEFPDGIIVEVGAGEILDEFIKWSVENKYSGLESLSGIPGTVGATPIQNVGAYGVEISELLVNVYAFDRQDASFKTIGLIDCKLGYRDSIFKREPNRFIIYKVCFELKKTPAKDPTYKDLKLYFLGKKKPSAKQIRNAVLEIRSKKLPNYKEIPNCGSFFKNPFVDITLLNKILEKHAKLPHFQIDENTFKLYAGWLIDNIDWQKIETENIKFHEKNKLVLTNTGNATFAELKKVIELTQKLVESHFGVKLEVEPRMFE